MKNVFYGALCAAALAACSAAAQPSASGEIKQAQLYQSACIQETPHAACYEVKAEYLSFGKPWLDKVLHQELTQAFRSVLDEQAQKTAPGNPPQLIQAAAKSLQENLQDMTDAGRDVRYAADFKQTVKERRGALLTIETVWYLDQGGAHPYHETRYLNADLQHNKILTMRDIVVKGSENRLADKLKAIYWDSEYFKDFSAEDKKAYAETWQENYENGFKNLDNFYFGRSGIVFSFVPYSVGPWAMGQVELTLPYSEAKGLIRSEYLK